MEGKKNEKRKVIGPPKESNPHTNQLALYDRNAVVATSAAKVQYCAC